MSDGLVTGGGQVGAAVAAVLGLEVRDVDDPPPVQVGRLHVCFPWSERFEVEVRRQAALHGASLTVVHSTVPVGTCDRNGWVHAPVTGRHPNLEQALTTFVMPVGGPRALEAAVVLNAAGILTDVWPRAAEVEAGKLWDLAQFAIQVRVRQAIADWCQQLGLDGRQVYTEAGRRYNDGYAEMDGRFVRAVLDHVPGPIGGHCVVPGAAMLGLPWLDGLVAGGFDGG